MEELEYYARLVYYEDYKKTGKEGFAIELKTRDEEEWGLDMFAPCVRREKADKNEEANFIHFGILKELAKLAEYGYTIFLGKEPL